MTARWIKIGEYVGAIIYWRKPGQIVDVMAEAFPYSIHYGCVSRCAATLAQAYQQAADMRETYKL